MTDDEQEAASTRYIAPRIMVLTSGNIAIIPMMGRDGPTIVSPEQFTLSLIPDYEQLERQKETSEAAMRERTTPSAPHKPTLDDLA